MAWWGWLLTWLAVASLTAVWLGLALRLSEHRDWSRRGRPERRARERPRDHGTGTA